MKKGTTDQKKEEEEEEKDIIMKKAFKNIEHNETQINNDASRSMIGGIHLNKPVLTTPNNNSQKRYSTHNYQASDMLSSGMGAMNLEEGYLDQIRRTIEVQGIQHLNMANESFNIEREIANMEQRELDELLQRNGNVPLS